MASLHYAIRAYATQGDPPTEILTKLSGLLHIGKDGQFATVLCAIVEVDGHRITLANVGHPPPILISPSGGEIVTAAVGPPVGINEGSRYDAVTLDVPPRATLLAFTDGLIERRGESIDEGLARLRGAANAGDRSLDDLLTRVVREALPDQSQDDTAILGLAWKT